MEYKFIKFHNTAYKHTQNIQIQIPGLCPFCQVSNNPTNTLIKGITANERNFAILFHKCTACYKVSFTLQIVEEKVGTIQSEYPLAKTQSFDPLIEELSPRFVDLYNQAYSAEQRNHTDVAGMGYRSALEVLIKDYALDAELDTKSEIARRNLNRSIDTYFKNEEETFISADVVRLLGNDFTHWDRDEETLSLETLKAYLNIFIQAILVKLMVKNPPVSR